MPPPGTKTSSTPARISEKSLAFDTFNRALLKAYAPAATVSDGDDVATDSSMAAWSATAAADGRVHGHGDAPPMLLVPPR
jgi:hypothetical protein